MEKNNDWVIIYLYVYYITINLKKYYTMHFEFKCKQIIPNVFKDNKQKLYQIISHDILDKCNILIQDQDVNCNNKIQFGRR